MRWQFIRFYVGFVVVLLIAALAFYVFVRRDFEKSMDQRLEQYMAPPVSRIRERLSQVEEGDREARLQALEESDGGPRDRDRPSRGRRRWHPPPPKLVSMDALDLSGSDEQRLEDGEVVVVRNSEGRFAYASVAGGEVLVMGPMPDRGREGDRSDSMIILFAPPLAVLMLIGITIFLLIRPIERRISSLVEVTRRFGEGQLTSRAQVGSTGSIYELEESFNAMAARIEHLVDGQKELLRAVSHDLRTPLARVFFAMDDAQVAGDVDEKNRHLKRIDRSLVELNDLVDELLTFMHLDEAAKEPQREAVDLSPILKDVRELVTDLCQDIELEVSCEVREIVADPRYVKRAVMNLVTNAVTHARKGVWISCRFEDGRFLFCVEDDGPGIPEEERKKVFEPFYRRDQSRNASLGGSGLGLAIVSRIMSWHDGSVEISESPRGGARFTLYFPGDN